MAMRSMSVDLKDSGILVMAMHPGEFEVFFNNHFSGLNETQILINCIQRWV
jgi:hypothetical protein